MRGFHHYGTSLAAMREFRDGFWTLTSVAGVPLRAHWSCLVVLVLMAWERLGPFAWASWLGIILIHEVAHLLVARGFGAKVRHIDIWALGGLCWVDGILSPLERSLMAAAGPGINLALAAIGIAVLRVAGPALGPLHGPVSGLAAANLGVGLVNLLPFPFLDGREALALLPRWLRARAAARSSKYTRHGRRSFGVIDGRGGRPR
jgi:stage IV sporulation protein FB